MKRCAIGALSVLLLLPAYVIFAETRPGIVSPWNYGKIRSGMTVKEAEAILGASQEFDGSYVPSTRDGPVVRGQQFIHWEDKRGREVWVATKDGEICDQWYWEPSL